MEPTTAAAAAAAAVPATASATQSGPMGGGMGIFYAMIAFLLIFMFLSSRSNKKREAEQKKLITSLQKGDRVVLIGGIVGTVAGFHNELIEVKISEASKLSVLPSGIVTVYKDAPAQPAKTDNANGAK